MAHDTSAARPLIGAEIIDDPAATPQKVDHWFQTLARYHMPLARVFIPRGEELLQRMDGFFRAAEKHGVGITATLGGRPSEENGRWIREVVLRYKDSPALDSWILINEPGQAPEASPQAVERFRAWLGEKYGTLLQGGNNTNSGNRPLCPTRADIAQWLWIGLGSGAERIVFWLLNNRSYGGESGEWSLLDSLHPSGAGSLARADGGAPAQGNWPHPLGHFPQPRPLQGAGLVWRQLTCSAMTGQGMSHPHPYPSLEASAGDGPVSRVGCTGRCSGPYNPLKRILPLPAAREGVGGWGTPGESRSSSRILQPVRP